MAKRILLVLISIMAMFSILGCGKDNYNAYVVPSGWKSVPIIAGETGQSVGQAYMGFAVSITEVRDDKAYFYLNISDPSVPHITQTMEFYIPIKYMKKAFVEPQAVPAIISLNMIRINPMAGISLFRNGKQQVIARFAEEIGPIQFIQNVEKGYFFVLGMNLVYVDQQDVRLIKYDD